MRVLNQIQSLLVKPLIRLTSARSQAMAPPCKKNPAELVQWGLRSRRFLKFHFLRVVLVLLVVGIWASPAPGEDLFVATTKGVLEFHVLEGDREWAWVERQRILGGLWLFSPDGTFFYRNPDGPKEVFPITGTFQDSEEALLFKGSNTSPEGWTSNIQGRIVFQDGQFILHMVESGQVEGRAETTGGSARRMTWSAVILLQAATIPSDKPQCSGDLSFLSWDFNEHRAG